MNKKTPGRFFRFESKHLFSHEDAQNQEPESIEPVSPYTDAINEQLFGPMNIRHQLKDLPPPKTVPLSNRVYPH